MKMPRTLESWWVTQAKAAQLTATLAVLKAWASGAALVLITVTKHDGAAAALADACAAWQAAGSV